MVHECIQNFVRKSVDHGISINDAIRDAEEFFSDEPILRLSEDDRQELVDLFQAAEPVTDLPEVCGK